MSKVIDANMIGVSTVVVGDDGISGFIWFVCGFVSAASHH